MSKLNVLYDGDCGLCTRSARLVARFDRHRRLRLVDFDQARRLGLASGMPDERFYASFHTVDDSGRIHSGPDALPLVIERLPLGRPFAAILRRSSVMQSAAARVYAWVAARRRLDECGVGAGTFTRAVQRD